MAMLENNKIKKQKLPSYDENKTGVKRLTIWAYVPNLKPLCNFEPMNAEKRIWRIIAVK